MFYKMDPIWGHVKVSRPMLTMKDASLSSMGFGRHCLCFCANPLDRPRDTSHCHRHSKNAVENVSICLQIAHKYLVEKNLSPADETQFKEQLYRIWFELYTRRGSSRWVESGAARKYSFTGGIWHCCGNRHTVEAL